MVKKAVDKAKEDWICKDGQVAGALYEDILNIPSEYRDAVIDGMPVIPPGLNLDAPPSEEELALALSNLRRRTAAGKTEFRKRQ